MFIEIMKKKSLLILMLFVSLFSIKAQSVSAIMNNVLSGIKDKQNISADFEITSAQFQTKGTFVMNGIKFRILTNDFKCWYDGKTQWIYTTMTNEVNIMEPTSDDLKLSNPYLAIMDYEASYNAKLKSKGKMGYIVELNAKNDNVNMSKIELTIDVNSYRITKAVVTMVEGDTQVVKLGNYIVNKKISDTTFVFDEKLVPKGTQLIDLR